MLLCAIGGFLTGLIFIFHGLNPLAFISVIPLIIALDKWGKSFKSGFLYGFFLNVSASFFLLYMHPLDFLGIYGFKSFIIAFGAYIGICLYQGLMWGIICFLFKKYIKSLWLFPIVYAAGEFILSLGITGYTFSHLYLVFYKNTVFIQTAALFSCYFITLIILFINLFIYKAYTKKTIYIIAAISVFIANTVYGIITVNDYKPDALPKENITLIQGNITSHEKWQNTNMYSILNTYKELTREAIEKTGSKIFIWPETVVPVAMDKDHNIYNDLKEFAKENEITLITGMFRKENNCIFNTASVFDENGNENPVRYKKRHLIPFSESNIAKGKSPDLITTPAGKAGVLICIDSAFSHLAYDIKKENPDFLVVLSNDSWFYNSHGVTLHNAHSVFRAVESRRYLLRCANTGITNIISPAGEILSTLKEGEKGYITYEK